MYGKNIDLGCGIKVWVSCTPRTPDTELQERAKNKVRLYLDGKIDRL